RYPNRTRARSRALAASASRSRAGCLVSSEASSRRATSETSSTAWLNAASLAFEGCVKPLSLRTNCSAEARISSSVAGGSKLNSVRMFRHMDEGSSRTQVALAWEMVFAPLGCQNVVLEQPVPPSPAKPVTIAVDAKVSVSGLLQAPPRARACYVLAHGAGAGMAHPFMATVAAGLAE